MHKRFSLANTVVGGVNMLTIFIRVLLVYLLLVGTMRIMGKRQIGELQLSELITTILLSELASQPIADSQIPLAFAVIPIAVLLSLEVIISFAVTKIPFLKTVFDGKPSVLIKHGKLDKQEISKVRISIEELISSIRIAGYGSIADVDYAILEQNGQLSVIPKRSEAPPTASDMNITTSEAGIAHAVIVDSKISSHDLKSIGRDERWLQKRLSSHNTTLDKVLLFTVDDIGKEFLVRK